MDTATQAVLTAAFDQMWTAAARGDYVAFTASLDRLADVLPDAAVEARKTLLMRGTAEWTAGGVAEPKGFRDVADGATTTLRGTVVARLPLGTAQGLPYMRIVLACDDGAVRVEVLPRTYDREGYKIAVGEPLTVYGRVDRRDERPNLLALRID